MPKARFPIRAIVGRFSNGYSRQVMEEVLRERPFEFCAQISSGIEPHYLQSIPQERQHWFISSEIRGCEYRDVDFGSLDPIDESLIEAMRPCEIIFMEMVARLEWKRSIPYDVRKRWYLRHLRFWNDYLTRHRINFYLSAWMPHEIPDILIYYLCKQKGIAVTYFECASMVRDTSFVEHDWEQSAVQIRDRYGELLREYAGVTDPARIPLGEEYERTCRSLIDVQGRKPPAHMPLPSYWRSVWRNFCAGPLAVTRQGAGYLTPRGLRRILDARHRGRIIRERNAFYDAHAVEPDLDRPFVYLPLHYQPEASTTPMSGVFVHQGLMAQLLNAHLPEDVLIYVKEHPWESGWLKRSVDFYRDLLELPKVRLIKRSVDTFVLREHCRAVATGTGTAGVEALFRGKPVFLFGHRFYQFARGVYPIHSSQDCAEAVRAIFHEKKTPSLVDCRLYLKAMEDTRVLGAINPWHHDVSDLPDTVHIASHVKEIVRQIDHFLG